MAKAKKLPSGSWRVQVFAGLDENGKRKYKSFTESTERRANLAALDWQEHHREITADSGKMTLEEAIDDYIMSRSNILSPSTIRGYEVIKRNSAQSLMHKQLNNITNKDIQKSINMEAKLKSPKTIKNAYGLVRTIMTKYRPNFKIDYMLPPPKKFVPSDVTSSDIKKLLEGIKGDTMELPILFALWIGLRRSEILALKWQDIDFRLNTVMIRRAIVPDKENKLIEKNTTKTLSSTRKIRLPNYIVEKLKEIKNENEEGIIFKISPNSPSLHLSKICEREGIPHLRLHDLRHIMASVGLLLNIGDKYMMERGGWSSKDTMKNVYQHTLAEGAVQAETLIDDYFNKLMQHEIQHEND